jgi:ABC-type sugar transport system substrate-binding protein
MIVAGCGSSGSGAGGGGTAAASAPAAASAKKHVTIAIGMTQNSVPYYETAQLGAEAAGPQEGNAKVVAQGPVDPLGGAVATVAQNLETSLNPDGFGVNPCILTEWTQVMNSLSRAVPDGNVIAWNCKPAATAAASAASPVKTFVGANDFQTGVEAAKAAVTAAHLGPQTTGTALLAECAEGIPILTARRAGALQELKQLLPKVTPVVWVSNPYNSKALVAWTSQLAKYPNVVFAYGSCDQDAAAISALKARGTGGNFAAAVTDPTSQELQQIENGQISAGVGTTPWVIANVASRLLIRHARGEAMPAGWVNTGLQPITKATAAQWLNATKSPAQAEAFFGPIADKVLSQLQADTKPMADAYAS